MINMKKIWFFIILFLISILLVSQGSSSLLQEELWNPEIFLKIYLDCLEMISPEIGIDYILNTPADQKKILDDIARNHKIVQELDLSRIELPPELLERFYKFVIPNLFNYLKRRELCPTKAEKEEYYRKNIKEYEKPESFEGARFLIENSPTMEDEASSWKKKLGNSTLSFRKIASEYYRSVGEDNEGYIGIVYKGTIRDEIFDAFYKADLNAPFFGPVKTKNGLLFGKVYKKQLAGSLPFEKVERRIEGLMIEERIKKFYSEFYKQERTKQKVEMVIDENKDEVPDLKSVVFKINGKGVTYEDVLKSHHNIFGDKKSIEFFRVIVEKAINDELVYNSLEAKKVFESKEYRFLLTSFIDQYKVFHLLKEEYQKISFTENDLINFYECMKDTLYKSPDEVKLLVVNVPINPDKETHPYNIHLAQKEAWKNTKEIWSSFINSPNPQEFSFKQYNNVRGLKVDIFDEWRPIDNLGRLIEMGIDQHTSGYKSQILIGRTEYIFYYIISRREKGFIPFEEINEKIKSDFLETKKKEVRFKFGIY